MRFLVVLLAALCVAATPAPSTRGNLEDFDAMWRAVDQGYPFLDGSARTAWRKARKTWRPRAAAAKSQGDLLVALEGALAHLADDYVSLSERPARSPRRVPAESDIWAEWRDGKAVVTAVRVASEADVAGVQPGHVVTHVQGIPIERAARERLRELGVSGPQAMNWVLRHFLAGPQAGALRLGVSGPQGTKVLEVERAPARRPNGPPIIGRRMGEDRDIGYLRIKDVLGDARLPSQVDGALGYLAEAKALILDLRETESGGAHEVAEALAARFAAAAQRARLVVLVDRWTAGEGEALAAALAASARATVIGTPTAGMRGNVRETKLPQSGIVVRFPAAPRAPLQPTQEVDLAAPSGGPGDPILYQALRWLAPSPARGDRSAPR